MSIGHIVRKHFATDSHENKAKGELCEVIGSCQEPQYWLRDSNGVEFWWCQSLVNQQHISPDEITEYWKSRAMSAERKLFQIERLKEGK